MLLGADESLEDGRPSRLLMDEVEPIVLVDTVFDLRRLLEASMESYTLCTGIESVRESQSSLYDW